MARATSRPPAPMAIDPQAPEVGVWESAPSRVAPGRGERPVGSRGEGGLAGPGADAVAGPGVVEAVAGGAALEEQVVVGVAVVELEHVVVDVLQSQVDPDPVQPQGLELPAWHRSGGVL